MSARKYSNYEYKYGFATCPTCKKEFLKHSASSKFCSVDCRKKQTVNTSQREINRKMWYEPDAFIINKNNVMTCRCYPCAENCTHCKLPDCKSSHPITSEEQEFIEYVIEACGTINKKLDPTR